MNITLCTSCQLGTSGFGEDLATAIATVGIAATVSGTDCMSGCTRASTIAFRAPGKMAYLFGDLTAADLPGLLVFARLYAASPDGTLADARPIGALRTKALARIPA